MLHFKVSLYSIRKKEMTDKSFTTPSQTPTSAAKVEEAEQQRTDWERDFVEKVSVP